MIVDAIVGTDDLIVSLVRPGETFDLKSRKRNPLVAGVGE
jgi:hypothetical protein